MQSELFNSQMPAEPSNPVICPLSQWVFLPYCKILLSACFEAFVIIQKAQKRYQACILLTIFFAEHVFEIGYYSLSLKFTHFECRNHYFLVNIQSNCRVQSPVLEIFYHTKKIPCVQAPDNHQSALCFCRLALSACVMETVIQYVICCFLLLSFNIHAFEVHSCSMQHFFFNF